MAIAVGPAMRIEPHKAASIAGEYTALAEMVCPSDSFRLVAVIRATALLGTEPAMGYLRLWDQTYKGFSQAQIYGTQTVVMHIPTVSVGDLVQVTASPFLDAGGYWAGTRVWVHSAEVTLVGSADVPASPNGWAPPLWPTQKAVADSGENTILSYELGDGWGLPATGTAWRFRPVGTSTWTLLGGQNASGLVTLPFDLSSLPSWEVQGQQSTGAGSSLWGPTFVWHADGVSPVPVLTGYGLTDYGTNYGDPTSPGAFVGYGLRYYGTDYGN